MCAGTIAGGDFVGCKSGNGHTRGQEEEKASGLHLTECVSFRLLTSKQTNEGPMTIYGMYSHVRRSRVQVDCESGVNLSSNMKAYSFHAEIDSPNDLYGLREEWVEASTGNKCPCRFRPRKVIISHQGAS